MLNISNEGIITITRGDTFEYPVFMNAGTELSPIRYIMTENDTLYFALMEVNQTFEDAILKKVFTSEDLNEHGDVVAVLDSQDTECLAIGKYYYTFKLKRPKGEGYTVDTVVPNRLFYIIE